MADGFTGHLEELSKFCKRRDNAWVNPAGEGAAGWEEVRIGSRAMSTSDTC
jgi:hypothetical protein